MMYDFNLCMEIFMKTLTAVLFTLSLFSPVSYAEQENSQTQSTSTSSDVKKDDKKETDSQSKEKPSIVDFCKTHTC